MKTLLRILWPFALSVLAACSGQPSKSDVKAFGDAVEAADKSYNLGLLSDAETKYLRVLEIRPEYYQAWLKLGNVYVRTAQFEAAIRAYSECINARPEEGKCWNNLAVVRVRQSLATLEQGQKTVVQGSDEWFALDVLYRRLVEAIAVKDQ